MGTHRPIALLVAGATTLMLAACGSGSGSGSGAGAAATSGAVRIVASTNVYGDIARTVGGADVQVTSIISDPAQDPHSYEADARTQLEISKADIVIENGGGYDDFVDTLRRASNSEATLINAVQVSGHRAPAGGQLNEHVWYDVAAVRSVVARLVSDLVAVRPADAATFRANAAAFDAKLVTLQGTEAAVNRAHAGSGAAITEPVPLYLLNACGLVDRTPAAFSAAIQTGDDVAVGVLNQTLGLFSSGAVKVLVYNKQTSGAETDKVLTAARAAKVPVVGVTETLPDGTNYISWMTANLAAIEAALA